MSKLIAVVEFAKNTKQYEYICEVPINADIDDFKFAVTFGGYNGTPLETPNISKAILEELNFVYIVKFKPVTDQLYAGTLRRLIMVFSIKEFFTYMQKRQKIEVLKSNLERRLADLSIFDKIKSMGIDNPQITSLADELKKLLADE